MRPAIAHVIATIRFKKNIRNKKRRHATLTYPLHDIDPGSPDRAAPATLDILLAEDEPDLRALVTIALRSAGNCTVISAGDAPSALRAIDERERPFDLVLLDIQMPGTTGTELCRILRGTPGYEQVPILMLTAMSEQQYLQDAFAAGANDYIAKPFDLEDVKARLMHARQVGQNRAPLQSGPRDALIRNEAHPPREVIRALEDDVAIPSARRFVTRDTFETFILQAVQRAQMPLTLRALKIAGAHDLFSRLAPEDFQKVVVEVARLISDQTTGSHDILSHLGNGMFVGACVGKSALDETALTTAIAGNAKLAALTAGGPPLHMVLGQDVAATGKTKADVMFRLARAVGSTEAAEEKVTSWGTFREWLSFRKSIGAERDRIDRSAYRRLLEDFIDDGELGWD